MDELIVNRDRLIEAWPDRPLPATLADLADEPLFCESCGEPLDAADAWLVGGEMWCDHCASDSDDPAPEGLTRIAGRAWVD